MAPGFKCTWTNPVTGRPCGNPTVYTRKYNLKRHIEQRHIEQRHIEQRHIEQRHKNSPIIDQPQTFSEWTPPGSSDRQVAVPYPVHEYGRQPSQPMLANPLFSLPTSTFINDATDSNLSSLFSVGGSQQRSTAPTSGAQTPLEHEVPAIERTNSSYISDSHIQLDNPHKTDFSDSSAISAYDNEYQEQMYNNERAQCDDTHLPCDRDFEPPNENYDLEADQDELDEGDENLENEAILRPSDKESPRTERVVTPSHDPLSSPSDESIVVVTPAEGSSSRKRQWVGGEGRDLVPEYEVKRSKKTPSQQRAIQWMTASGKQHFDSYLSSTLANWGVTPAHKASCVSLPASWAALDSMSLMEIFEQSNCPRGRTNGPHYKLDDHQTFLTRAAAWFDAEAWEQNPRRGVDLDNFLDSHWQHVHGSHLCHHELCALHLVLESATLNEDRKRCHERAHFLRGERRPVPERCDCHNHVPRCYLRLAALTRFESFLRQFAVLRHARGLPPMSPPRRPRRHRYHTFEYRVDLEFCNGSPPSNAISSIVIGPPARRDRLDLICPFCKREIMSFTSVIHIWSHIFHQHADTDNNARLEAIRQKGQLWHQHFAGRTHRGKADPLMVKLAQTERHDFDWDVVVSWHLR